MANQKTKKTTKSTSKTTNSAAKSIKPAKKTSIIKPIIGAVIVALVIIAAVIGITLLVDNINKSKRVGTYDISSLYINGEEENSVELLNALGLTASIELRDDNTCTLNLFGEQSECTYDDTNLHMIDTDTDTPYTYKNNEITVADNGNTMTFTRAEE